MARIAFGLDPVVTPGEARKRRGKGVQASLMPSLPSLDPLPSPFGLAGDDVRRTHTFTLPWRGRVGARQGAGVG